MPSDETKRLVDALAYAVAYSCQYAGLKEVAEAHAALDAHLSLLQEVVDATNAAADKCYLMCVADPPCRECTVCRVVRALNALQGGGE